MLSQKTINDIIDHAATSDLARYTWTGRGKAPMGYVKGMAVTFGLCLQKLMAGDSAALAMVRIVDDGRDVFDHYQTQIQDAGLATDGASDVDRLLVLFGILTGLGMRESSGRYCCGRDTTAAIPPSSDTVEAGLFQQSWDSRRASPEIAKLLDEPANKQTFLDIFKEGVTVRKDDLFDWGDGAGRAFQAMCKASPAFAVQVAAIGLRTLYTHWGPIVRREAEISPAAISLFRQVQKLVGADAPVVAQKPAGGWLAALIAAIAAMFRSAPAKPPEPPEPRLGQPPATWMVLATKEVGFHETGANRNIGRYTGPAKCGSEGDPWCSIFVNAMLESVGIRGTRSAMARSFEHDENFVKLDGPAYGAVTTMWRQSKGSGLGHVFFYVGESDKGILSLGGNQSDQVCRQYEPRNRIVGYFWPKSQPLPKVGKIVVKDTTSTEGTEV